VTPSSTQLLAALLLHLGRCLEAIGPAITDCGKALRANGQQATRAMIAERSGIVLEPEEL
jgi:hypothetical protein